MNSIRKPDENDRSQGLSVLPPYTATLEDVRTQLENKAEGIRLADGRIFTWVKGNDYSAVRITNTVQGGYCEIRQMNDGSYIDHTVDSAKGQMPDQPISREELAKRLQSDIIPHLPVNGVQGRYRQRASNALRRAA